MTLEPDLRELYERLRAKKRSEFNRDLPFTDLLFDRWERAKALGFGEGTSVYHDVYVLGDVSVGRDTWIGMGVILDGSGALLRIGDGCNISAGVHIYTHDSVQRCVTGGQASLEVGPVTIGNRVYIAPQSVIARGVTIGDGAIVAVHSFVNRDVEAGSRVGGNPARVIL